jgi:hypothetical protein
MDDERGSIGGMNGKGNPAPVSFFPHDLTLARTRQGGKPGNNRLSYGAAYDEHTFHK